MGFLGLPENVDQWVILDHQVLQARQVLLDHKVQLVNLDNQENLEVQEVQGSLVNQAPQEIKGKKDHQGHLVFQEKRVHQVPAVYQDFLANED